MWTDELGALLQVPNGLLQLLHRGSVRDLPCRVEVLEHPEELELEAHALIIEVIDGSAQLCIFHRAPCRVRKKILVRIDLLRRGEEFRAPLAAGSDNEMVFLADINGIHQVGGAGAFV
ncbi:hypothetical protein PG990_011667 [Apiospora arundinis]